MKKAGEILKRARLQKNLTLAEAEKATKIRLSFLKALEEGDYQKLPSPIYIKGFLKNYSEFLEIPPGKVLALFRREFDERKSLRILPAGLTQPLNESFLRITPSRLVFLSFLSLLLLFFGYLYREYRTFARPPLLIIEEPAENALLESQDLEIRGRTDKESLLTLNGQIVLLSQDGYFRQEITLPPGLNTLTFVAKNKLGKERKVVRTVRVSSP